MFRINPSQNSKVDNFVPNKHIKASVRTKPITVSQPHVINKKDVNSYISGYLLQEYKSLLGLEDHNLGAIQRMIGSHKHMSSECNNIKLAIQNDKSKVVCATCYSKHMTGNLKLLIIFVWNFLGTVRFRNDYVAAILSYGDLQWANIMITQPKWSRYVTIVHQTKDLHTSDYTQLYEFLKYNQKEVDELKAERLAKIQDPLALMANSNNLSKSELQGMTSRQISSRLDLTYASSTITSQKPTIRELELLYEVMYDDYSGGEPLRATRTDLVALTPQVLQTLTVSLTIVNTATTPINSSSQAKNIPNTSHDVDELPQQCHV
nr:integrase, catalytic region, zinc finger, CCHC-type, peptidase aspartic, catalytic [Tanacetum cinerariifolium]